MIDIDNRRDDSPRAIGAARIVAAINTSVEYLIIGLFAILLVDVLLAIVCRFALNDSLVWAEELARYLFIWTVFLAAGIAVERNTHIVVGSIGRHIPRRMRHPFRVFVDSVATLFALLLLLAGVRLVVATWDMPALLLPIPMGIVYLCVPLAAAVMSINLAARAMAPTVQ